MLDVSNLRHDLPNWDRMGFYEAWLVTEDKLLELGESDIPCAMRPAKRRLCFQIIRAMGAKSVLDIGTYVGTSAANYGAAVGSGGRVVTVDIRSVDADNAHWKQVGRNLSPRALMEAVGVADRVQFVTCDARKYLAETAEKFDFISIDGWHEYFAVYEEIRLALTRLNPDGLIFLDDIQIPGQRLFEGCDRFDGPWRALQRHISERAPFEVIYIPHMLDLEPTSAAFLVRP
jgi:predicted O-methyltransferase YrrM